MAIMSERKQYGALDFAKFIASIIIIVLHTNPFSSYSSILNFGFRNIITIVAVPFFFITSGCLFCAKLNSLNEDSGAYLKKYIKRLVVMYLLWSAVYFVFVATDWVKNGVSLSDVLQYIKRFFFEGSYQTIWFLPALMTSVSIVYLLRKKLSYKNIFILAIPFYVIACFGSSYYGLSVKIPVVNNFYNAYFSFFDTIKNGVLFGWIYVALGGVFSEKTFKTKPCKYFVLSCTFFVLMAGETIVQTYLKWATNGVDTKFILLPLSASLFCLVMSLNIKTNPVLVRMRELSLLMFLSQRIFLTLFDWLLTDTIFVQNSMVYFISILGFTIIFSRVFIVLSEKIKILKRFY